MKIFLTNNPDEAIESNVAIKEEIQRGYKLYGDNNTMDEWSNILGEEYGEAVKEVNEMRLRSEHRIKSLLNLNKELIQVIAVAMRWLFKINEELFFELKNHKRNG